MPSGSLQTHMGFHSPLRYPGGKGALSAFMRDLVARNGLLDGHYAEVYAGGAAVAWSLLFSDHVQHVHINDVDPAIYAFWRSVLADTDALCSRISGIRVSMAAWRRQREVMANPRSYSRLERGFATFFLNRTNRSGIITGGVIGGEDQAGEWKLDARFNKRDLISRITRIARYRERVTLTQLDALEFMNTVLGRLPNGSLMYLDPPYYVRGRGLYEHHYNHDDHAAVAEAVRALKAPSWVVSYDAAPQVLKLYQGLPRRQYDLRYTAQERYEGSEVFFFSPRLIIPRTLHPSRKTAA